MTLLLQVSMPLRQLLEICMENIGLQVRSWTLKGAVQAADRSSSVLYLTIFRLEQIRKNIDGRVRIALHGTNGFEPELLKKCIAAGASKINVNRMVLDDYNEHLKIYAGKIPLTQLMTEGTEKVVLLTMKWMEICGSAGKA